MSVTALHGSGRSGHIPPATKFLKLDGEFRMHRGDELPEVELAYETWGTLNNARDNAVLLFAGMSPSAHAASCPADRAPGWWEDMVGPGRPIDTNLLFVVCINSLGSCFGSTGPASIDPRDGQAYRLRFPVLSIEDIAEAAHAVVEHLEIRDVQVIGPSMGGMAALAYSVMHPDRVSSLACVSSAARALPFSIALRSLQREIIRKDPAWKGGDYDLHEPPITGMRLARKLGMITYRSAEEWKHRFGRERASEERMTGQPFGVEFSVESYLEAHANKFTGAFDANCYLYLSRAMDLFDIGEHGGCTETALACVKAPRILVIGVESDILYPLEQQRELAECLDGDGRKVEFHALPSKQGHDSFLVDMDRFRPIIGNFYHA